MQVCYEMVIKLHVKGGRASGNTAGNIAEKPIYEITLSDDALAELRRAVIT